MPQDGHRPGGHDLSAHDAAHQRGLSAARGPEQPGDRAPGDVDGEVVERDLLASHHPQMAGVHGAIDAALR